RPYHYPTPKPHHPLPLRRRHPSPHPRRRPRISGTSRCFFELSGATNSTIGFYQIDYVNFRPNRATEWDSTPKRCSRASSLDAPLLGEADGAVAYHSESFQSAASRDAAAIGGAREGMPRQSRILRIASGG